MYATPNLIYTDLYTWALVLITLVDTVIFSITITLSRNAISISTLEVYVSLALFTRLAKAELKVIYSNMGLNQRKHMHQML